MEQKGKNLLTAPYQPVSKDFAGNRNGTGQMFQRKTAVVALYTSIYREK